MQTSLNDFILKHTLTILLNSGIDDDTRLTENGQVPDNRGIRKLSKNKTHNYEHLPKNYFIRN